MGTGSGLTMTHIGRYVAAHIAQIHRGGCLLFGAAIVLLTLFWWSHVSVRGGGRRGRLGAIVSTAGFGMLALALVVNAFFPLKAHSLDGLFMPVHGAALIWMAGFVLQSIPKVSSLPRRRGAPRAGRRPA